MNCPSCNTPVTQENQIFCASCQAYLNKARHAQRAPFTIRLLAYILDLGALWGSFIIILYLLNYYVTQKTSLTAIFTRVNWVKWGSDANLAIFIATIAFLIWMAYGIYMILLVAKGITPGKRYFNLRVVKADGSHIDFWTLFVIREICGRLLSTIPLFLGYFWALFDRNAQTWHDKLAGTVVLELSKEAVEKEKSRKKLAVGGVMIAMRDNAAAVLFFLVVLFVLSLMFSGGLGGADIVDEVVAFFTGEGGRGIIASVNGRDIFYEEYDQYYTRKLEEYRERSGNSPEEGYELENFDTQLWDELINTILISQYIDKNKLHASNNEIVYELLNNPPDEVKQIPAFQTNGVFDKNKYDMAWQNTGDEQTNQFWRYLELRMKELIPRQKLTEQLLSTVRLTDAEIKDEYLKRHQEMSVHYLFFNPGNYNVEESSIPEKELRAYYDAHKQDYKEEAKRQIAYIVFNSQPTKIDSSQVRERALELLADVKRPDRDFAKLAQENSEDKGSAAKGGDLGFFGRGMMLKPFEDAAFAAQPGDIVGPVQSPFGLHIIKVEEKKTENNAEQVRARHILLKFSASEETMRLSAQNARFFAETTQEKPFDEVVKLENLKVDTTNFFPAGGFIPGIGRNVKAAKFIFQKVIGTISHPYHFREGYFVFKITGAIEETTKPFEEIRPQIVTQLKRVRQEEMALNAAQRFLEKVQGINLAQAALNDSLKVEAPKPFTFNGYVEGAVGRDVAFIGNAFGLENGQISRPVKGTRGIYLIEMISKKPFDEQDLDAKEAQLRAELLRQKQQYAYNEWFTQLKAQAKIKDYRDRYFL